MHAKLIKHWFIPVRSIPNVTEYIARFNFALNQCSDATDIKAKLLFKENLWPEIVFQVINHQPLNLKDSQTAAQRARSKLKHAGMFKHAKRKS